MCTQLHDIRDRAVDPHPKGYSSGGRTKRRDVSKIDTVVIHQAGIAFSAKRGQELYERALGVACHAMAFRDGSAVLAAPASWYIIHGNRYNATSLGLEIDGRYPGVRGGKAPGGKPATPEDPLVVEAARLALSQLVRTAREDGCPITKIRAHRQADSWRRADPGEWLYQEVVLAYAIPVLGLEADINETLGHYKGPKRRGKPIPREWDPASSHRY